MVHTLIAADRALALYTTHHYWGSVYGFSLSPYEDREFSAGNLPAVTVASISALTVMEEEIPTPSEIYDLVRPFAAIDSMMLRDSREPYPESEDRGVFWCCRVLVFFEDDAQAAVSGLVRSYRGWHL